MGGSRLLLRSARLPSGGLLSTKAADCGIGVEERSVICRTYDGGSATPVTLGGGRTGGAQRSPWMSVP